MRHWSAFGAVLMWTVALSNTSCSSYRQVEHTTREEKQTETETTREEVKQEQQEQIKAREETDESVTVTEIEIYDTDREPDPTTGALPVKARIKQRTDRTGTAREVEELRKQETTDLTEKQVYSGGKLSEAVVVAEKPASLWERMKKGVMWGAALTVLAAALWIFVKLKKTIAVWKTKK